LKTTSQNTNGPLFDVISDQLYFFEVWLKANKPNSRIYIELRDQDGTLAVESMVSTGDGSARPSDVSYLVTNLPLPTTWTRYSGIVKLTAVSKKVAVRGVYWNHSNGTERDAVQSIAGMRLRPINPEHLMSNIHAEKIDR